MFFIFYNTIGVEGLKPSPYIVETLYLLHSLLLTE
jgi:hypothetical protein